MRGLVRLDSECIFPRPRVLPAVLSLGCCHLLPLLICIPGDRSEPLGIHTYTEVQWSANRYPHAANNTQTSIFNTHTYIRHQAQKPTYVLDTTVSRVTSRNSASPQPLSTRFFFLGECPCLATCEHTKLISRCVGISKNEAMRHNFSQ